MATTEGTDVETEISELADALTAIDAERADDPVDRAVDVATWRAREDKRTARAADLAERLRRRRTFGTLLDDPQAWDTVQNYGASVRDARTALAYVTEHRAFRTGRSVPPSESRTRALGHLGTWLRGLRTLSRLPDTGDAHRYRAGEVEAWLRTRIAVAAAMLDREGDLPVPEGPDGVLPGLGLRVGAQRVEAHDGAEGVDR
ncbi:hypothetical protein [Pseudonocardia sp. NPDC049635]|uniref:hypothetical protein n=1 Tax=Pseudonocardia sp. NPDC049635 TaxID=3155506 RepID=UPI0033F7AA94